MTGTLRCVAAIGIAAGFGLSGAHASITGVYDISFDRTRSGLSGGLTAQASTAGTLIGNYDPVENPTGTRTKPGLFGTFGSTENVAVPVTLGGTLGGPIATPTTGGLRLDAGSEGVGSVSGLSADLLGGGSLALPLSITLSTEAFRTRTPTFLYPGGIPITVPLGEATVTQLLFEQIGAAPATLTKQPDGSTLLESAVVALFTVRMDLLGNPVDIPGAPVVIPISASLREQNGALAFSQSRPIDLGQTANPDVELPAIPFALPTLTPDTPANVILSLRLSEISAALNGAWTVSGDGVLVPAPSALLAALLGVSAISSRRRRGT